MCLGSSQCFIEIGFGAVAKLGDARFDCRSDRGIEKRGEPALARALVD
jgi:hypothetical protein